MQPSPDLSRALIIVNPVSGTQGLANDTAALKALALSYGWAGTIVETTPDKGADTIIASALKKGLKHVVVCGGDGTIMQAVAALVHSPVIMGVVPGGTGNLFAQNIGLPTDPKEALKVALTGHVSSIDVGRANGTYFTIMAGMGLDAQMVQDASVQQKNRLGRLAYVVALLKNLPRRRGRYAIALDHQAAKTYRAKSVMVANLGKIAGGLEVVPETDPQNGVLNIGIICSSSFASWVSVLTHSVLGRVQKSPQYVLLKGQHIELTPKGRPQLFECDGNAFPATQRLVVDVLPHSLWVIRS